MCLGIPGRVVEIKGENAKVDVGGAERKVSLSLLEDASVGDYVIVHAGFAIQKVNEKEALQAIKLFDGFAEKNK